MLSRSDISVSMSPCLNGETAARDLTLTHYGGGSTSDMQRSPLYLVGCGWVGEDFWPHGVAPSSSTWACTACSAKRPKTRMRKHEPRAYQGHSGPNACSGKKPKCISRVGPVQVDAYLSAGRSNSSRAFKARLLFRAPAQCLPITLNSLRSVLASLENGALSTVRCNEH